MVGGVSPGKGGGTHLGLPVFNSVKEVSVFIQLSASAYLLAFAESIDMISIFPPSLPLPPSPLPLSLSPLLSLRPRILLEQKPQCYLYHLHSLPMPF